MSETNSKAKLEYDLDIVKLEIKLEPYFNVKSEFGDDILYNTEQKHNLNETNISISQNFGGNTSEETVVLESTAHETNKIKVETTDTVNPFEEDHQNKNNGKSFPCDVCEFRTNYRSSLQTHKKRHLIKKPFISGSELCCKCVICNILTKGFSRYNCKEKKKIIAKGRPTPALNNLTKQTKLYVRHFQKENYETCEWLTGCDNKSLLFCWPCILFSNEKDLWNKNGFADLNNLHKLIKRHASGQSHIRAIIKEKTFGKTRIERTLDNLRIDTEKHNQEVRKNREILKRLIDVVCFMGEHELAFRGHSETEHSSNKGNYVDLVNLLAKYDEILQSHLDNSTIFKETSNLIQNDLILCIEKVILKKIKYEIDEAPFVGIILDETTDVANISQLSKVLRYVTKKGEIKERFIGFLDVSTQRTASALHGIVQTIVNDYNCGSKLVAQSYDGAAVTAGEFGGLQVKVKETYPSALFVHCSAHRLNLVLQQSLNVIKECKIFFQTLRGLAAFFSKSAKRASALDREVYKRLPKVAPTRWNYNGRLVQTVFEYRQPLIEFFQNIMDNQAEWDNETVVCSRGYLNMLETETNFNLLLNIFSDIFPFCDNLFAILQNKTGDINFCIKKIRKFQSIVCSKREQFDDLWTKFEHLQIEPQRKRIRTDIAEEHRTDEKSRFRKLFFEIIDNISTHIDSRFNNFKNLQFLELVHFHHKTTVPEEAFDSLKQTYPQYFDFPVLRSELTVIYNTSEGLNKTNASELWKSLKDCGLDHACPEILKLCELTLTIPATSASTGRSFSALKRIKSFVRNFTGQERFSALGLISIEKELVQEYSRETSFYDDVIDEFAKENRRMALHFK